MAIRTELYCHFCGHGTGEVYVLGSGRPTNEDLREAYQAQRPGGGPRWVGDGPRCPRCGGQLFLGSVERARLPRAS